MDIYLALKAIVMGLVEGFTEFLPISSTGHLILAGSLLNFTDEKSNIFKIVIQSGAILAVCWEFNVRIRAVFSGIFTERKQQKFVLNLMIAFTPLAVLGLIFGKFIKQALFHPVPVALSFIIGGLIILWVEARQRGNPVAVRVGEIDDMTPLDALKVGLAQAVALIPGTSRSGATIIGSMMFGLTRKAATEFSFFLAIPTLMIATAYELIKNRDMLTSADLPLFGIGSFAAFVSAFLCVRWLLRYISSHDFTVFAWYRIAFGILVIASSHYGWVVWVE
ncbi:undecaprenyl-diphosphate phosphatase [Massilia sp. PAMC28688]|uniref:undecaprenyl-diphosphate phosphatase n=1 Tax=Massilia sp. PAMC28688 TaxID=2861283 RepID=UPI001C63A070|nr:undecaprenyl-diphosphate phosphatase [Massilia sp. PAMC28688]QYF95604.1 undecaprenyl-diphosphate phosphatase [Massilia sp. PAMC28688]